MTQVPSAPIEPVDLDRARQRVEAVLDDFLRQKSSAAARLGFPTEVPSALRDFLAAGGKRLRPVLCVLGWHAAGGEAPVPDPVVHVAAALEMFHAFALVHDDIMDASDTRRGRPTIHRALATHYATYRPPANAKHLGTSIAILAGDFALNWTDELLHSAALPPVRQSALLAGVHAMRDEVLLGQLLDLTCTGQPTADIDRALAIARFKTAKYTVERPLHIGAALAGADHDLLDALTEYALPLGEAFQLRDDLLGAFGDPHVTGKSKSDDLREGKHTMLVALALRNATPAQATVLRRLLGSPDLTDTEADHIRSLLTVTGARTQVERTIDQRRATVLRHLEATSPIAPAAVPHLRQLADATIRRSS